MDAIVGAAGRGQHDYDDVISRVLTNGYCMKTTVNRGFETCSLFLLLCASTSFADVRLPKLLCDGAILQRDNPAAIWGWADNPDGANLNNLEGLPASPFQSTLDSIN